jgi:Domain of unknown function (DUF4430)
MEELIPSARSRKIRDCCSIKGQESFRPRSRLVGSDHDCSRFTGQGVGSGKRNWLYSINGVPAKEGFGVYQLKETDRVSWRFSAAHTKSQAQRKE